MALTRPILKEIVAFDATQNQTINFSSIGGDQVVKNKIIVYDPTQYGDDGVSLLVVYTSTVETYQYRNSIPANTLTNGKNYDIKVITYNANNEESEISDAVNFYCYTTPTLQLQLPIDQEINYSFYLFEVEYDQLEGELLDYVYYNLYDETGKLINTSPKLFNDSETLPLTCDYTFYGFVDGAIYRIEAIGYTINGTEIRTPLTTFYVHYTEPILRSKLILKSICNQGYVSIKSNAYIANGTSNPDPPIYINESISGNVKQSVWAISPNPVINYNDNTNYWVRFNQGFVVPKNFIFKYWFTVGTVNNNIIELDGDDGAYIKVSYQRCILGDYVQLYCSNGTKVHSNIIPHTNSLDQLFLWLKYNEESPSNKWEVVLEKLSTETLIFDWNNPNNNYRYNMTTNLSYINENYENKLPEETFSFMEESYDSILFGNAICRLFTVSLDMEEEYNTEFKDWEEGTLLRCNFDGNLKAGNVAEQLDNLTGVKIKRKDENTQDWLTLYEKSIREIEDLSIEYIDSFVPSGIEQTYALVPVLQDGEGAYLASKITPKWDGVFISDKDKIFKLYSGVAYGTTTQNKPTGIMNTIGGTYPIIVQNGENNYKSGAVSGRLLGYTFEYTHIIDRVDVINQVNDFLDFLVNGKAKFISDWNGNHYLVRILDSPNVSYDSSSGNAIANISFSWVEQGKYNNQKDLDDNNISKFIKE